MTAPSFAVVGAGIIGAAVARELTLRYPDARVTLFEKEDAAARHQTGHNSGVVHAGLYYEPGGLKARLCRRGVDLIRDLSLERGVPYEECGKVVVAQDDGELARLRAIHERAVANGVPGVAMLDATELRDVEPNAVGLAALHSPHTAIIDYAALTDVLVADVRAAGGEVRFCTPVHRLREVSTGVEVHTGAGAAVDTERFDAVLVCAGLQSDRVARESGEDDSPSIVPFFGQYFLLEPEYAQVVRGLVYPTPDPAYPFLGVHITRRIDGSLMIGPNAFLSFSREIYRGLGLDLRDATEIATNPGFWRFAGRNLPAAWREIGGVVSSKRFVAGAARYVPELAHARGTRLTRGIRAQAIGRDGGLVDDFVLHQRGRATFVRNAPSPGATSSLAIAEHLVDQLAATHDFGTPTPRAL